MNQDKRRVKNRATPRIESVPIRTRPENLGLAPTQRRNRRPPEDSSTPKEGELQGVYIISVASRLLEMHPQTLRKYERLGLVRPFRTIGMLRLYSEEDIEKLRLIKYLEGNLGLNLAGVEFTLNLLNHLLDMRRRLSRMQEATEFAKMVEQELEGLLHRLNLPLQE